ncbi:Neurofilament medium polypeptide [Trichinella pseudospiralis]
MLEKLASNCKAEKPERASSPVAVADRSIRYNCYRSGRGQWSIHHYWSATVSYCCATVERWQQSIDHRVVHATGRPSQVKWSPLYIDDRSLGLSHSQHQHSTLLTFILN